MQIIFAWRNEEGGEDDIGHELMLLPSDRLSG